MLRRAWIVIVAIAAGTPAVTSQSSAGCQMFLKRQQLHVRLDHSFVLLLAITRGAGQA